MTTTHPTRATLPAAALATLLTCTLTTPATARPPRYTWPLPPPQVVLRTFQAPTTPYGPGHRGVDLGAAAGTRVMAAADATVVFAGPVGERQVVALSHEGGIRTTYEPVTPTVEPGQRVTRGTPIATLEPGHDGCATPCLHWGAHRTTTKAGRTYLDPLALLAAGRVRLLPTGPPGGSADGFRSRVVR
ncbi:M23 family metallopeptidase [Saccharothrix variisporea]|uniref:Peptidase M23-like protein n=1 Tax=Saccharothrix variisporea TaxID=543527 RepID=A0A495XN17_9PSEU|nr:M23 family metallopeptidase [Saccharothrix variisporea]RKT73028.1 peptidase M23-like protein [Saccharothrix variisporea]